jgi:hypothetical protein
MINASSQKHQAGSLSFVGKNVGADWTQTDAVHGNTKTIPAFSEGQPINIMSSVSTSSCEVHAIVKVKVRAIATPTMGN